MEAARGEGDTLSMRRALVGGIAFALASFVAASTAVAQQSAGRDVNTIRLAGRDVHCNQVRLRLDRNLDNLGAAALNERLLMLNPRLLRQYGRIVQLFVFHHECGHHRVGSSELKADCWAVDRGVRDGWLDRGGLGQVCRSFDGAPETDTHPSGRRRCANIDRCFARTTAAVAREKQELTARIAAVAARNSPPRLVSGPRLVRQSVLSGYAPPTASPRTAHGR
jgi:hypothetical protein